MQEGKKLLKIEDADNKLKCRFISKWFKIDSYVSDTEGLIPEIEKLKPDVVILDFNLYKKIGGIEIMHTISDRFDIPVWYE